MCLSYILNWKWHKTAEKKYLEQRNQQTNDSKRFSILKSLEKGNNSIIGPCQQAGKVQCMYLVLIHLKISSKNVQQCSQNLNQGMNDVFGS